MLVLDPGRVAFAGDAWSNVTVVTVDRVARSPLVAYGGTGPHAVLVDAVERRVIVRVVQMMLSDDFAGPVLGSAGVLVFATGRGSGAGSGSAGSGTGASVSREVRVDQAVVTEVTYAVASGALTGRASAGASGVAAAGARGATRTVVLIGMSSDGSTDPVSVVAVGA